MCSRCKQGSEKLRANDKRSVGLLENIHEKNLIYRVVSEHPPQASVAEIKNLEGSKKKKK